MEHPPKSSLKGGLIGFDFTLTHGIQEAWGERKTLFAKPVNR